ncbi:MAG: hypothetical protein F9K24_18125 [Leptonema illini]|uniref:Uncharacterized protein n=1 Tax=Leptonema illini TaxID=183 RepID=A0A833GYL5_9LEPT|nr:MAG: hypothetical protein F9K24_18125 [Leptonema illini]
MNIALLKAEAARLKRNGKLFMPAIDSDSIDGVWINNIESQEIFAIKDQEQVMLIQSDGIDSIEIKTINGLERYQDIGISFKTQEYLSYPCIDYLFKYGNQEVQEWLAINNWRPDWSYNSNFKDPLARDYELWWQTTYPFFNPKDLIGFGNSWIFNWPEDNEELLLNPVGSRHVITTLRESEPWYEVLYYEETGYVGFVRTT